MKERPILMSAPMVRALLAGSKSQTRRVIKPQPVTEVRSGCMGHWSIAPVVQMFKCPYGEVGDRLWVRETWASIPHVLGNMPDPRNSACSLIFRADKTESPVGWNPSIFLPRTLSRITLEIADVRVERLQDISEDDCIAEGIKRTPVGGLSTFEVPGTPIERLAPKIAYEQLWKSVSDPGSWVANPWVWVIEFKSVSA